MTQPYPHDIDVTTVLYTIISPDYEFYNCSAVYNGAYYKHWNNRSKRKLSQSTFSDAQRQEQIDSFLISSSLHPLFFVRMDFILCDDFCTGHDSFCLRLDKTESLGTFHKVWARPPALAHSTQTHIHSHTHFSSLSFTSITETGQQASKGTRVMIVTFADL